MHIRRRKCSGSSTATWRPTSRNTARAPGPGCRSRAAPLCLATEGKGMAIETLWAHRGPGASGRTDLPPVRSPPGQAEKPSRAVPFLPVSEARKQGHNLLPQRPRGCWKRHGRSWGTLIARPQLWQCLAVTARRPEDLSGASRDQTCKGLAPQRSRLFPHRQLRRWEERHLPW